MATKDAKAGDKAKAQANAADTREDYTPVATSREPGKNSRGEATIYPSDVEAVSSQYGLIGPEAERLLLGGKVTDKEAEKIRGERVVYRAHYEYVTNPSTVAVAAPRAAEEESTDRKAAADRIATDKTHPEAGPYGPEATYTEVEAPNDTDHTSPDQPKEEK